MMHLSQGTGGRVVPGQRRKIVVLGMMSRLPVAGVIWQTIHYLIGFQRLGYKVYYVEAHARTPSMLMQHENDDSSARAAAFIAGVMRRFGLGNRWAFHALHADGRYYGMSEHQVKRLYRSAALIINLHGGTQPLPEHSATDRLVYLETDPVALQIELHHNVQYTLDILEPHCAFFTFAENYGNPDCKLPASDRFDFRATRQPVVVDFWLRQERPMTDLFDVGVVGTGYVGLTTGACLAHIGHRVTCVDNNARLVAELGEGRIPFYEPGLEELVERDVRDGRLRFSTDLAPLVGEADIVFIAVGTPQGEDGSADLVDVAAVARGVGRALSEVGTAREHPLVVVNKSTVPVGSGDYVSMLIQEGIDEAEGGEAGSSGEGVELKVASNPEFLREGSAIYDSLF